jgi:hypothetical protein
MRFWRKTAMIVVLGIGSLIQTVANAQSSFFISYSALSVASCTTTSFQGTITASYSLPSGSNNLYSSISINGGPAAIQFYTINPSAATNNPLAFTYTIPATAQPYLIQGFAYPSLNGAPVGTGVNARYTCNSDGTVSAVFDPIATVTTAVPTLSQWSIGGLAILLAMGSWVLLRRKHKLTR